MSDPMGGAAGEAYANTLKSPGMRPEHVLSREAIQNSVDAAWPAAPKVTVRFRAVTLSGKAKTRFVEAAVLQDIAQRRSSLELAGPNCLGQLEQPAKALNLLFVDDFNAVGLTGHPHDQDSNFYRLLLSLGDRAKTRTKGTGGSYGFGKSVYSSSSAIQTIFAYTRFETEDGKSMSRIFGCGYYASHEFKKERFSGRAWLGLAKKSDRHGRQIVDPLEGEEADLLAEKLGFELRGPSDFGTSILIVYSDVDPEQVRRGVEDWWWPRLVENRLDVEIIAVSGEKLIPRPRRREDLRPFIDAFDIATQRAEPIKGQHKFAKLNNLEDLQLGTCGFTVIPLGDKGPLTAEDRSNNVALIRSPSSPWYKSVFHMTHAICAMR
jgi:hypothetical protein